VRWAALCLQTKDLSEGHRHTLQTTLSALTEYSVIMSVYPRLRDNEEDLSILTQ